MGLEKLGNLTEENLLNANCTNCKEYRKIIEKLEKELKTYRNSEKKKRYDTKSADLQIYTNKNIDKIFNEILTIINRETPLKTSKSKLISMIIKDIIIKAENIDEEIDLSLFEVIQIKNSKLRKYINNNTDWDCTKTSGDLKGDKISCKLEQDTINDIRIIFEDGKDSRIGRNIINYYINNYQEIISLIYNNKNIPKKLEKEIVDDFKKLLVSEHIYDFNLHLKYS